MHKLKFGTKIVFFLIILIIVFFASFAVGRLPIQPLQILGMIYSELIHPIKPFWTSGMEAIFFHHRLPRILIACLVGCCLSAAGASYQGIFQNPMAAPDILGASSGAAFGAALAILRNGGSMEITISAFVFSLITVALVTVISKKAAGSKILGLVLAGIMVSSLFTAGTSYIKLIADPNDKLPQITFWLMGSFSSVKTHSILFALLPMAVGLVPLILLRWRINILTLGDEEAESMGVNTQRVRLIVIVCATLITAASVSVSGIIGWVGLVIPHFARRIVGNNYIYLLPLTMIIGALFLLIVDDIARNLFATELPLGILTAIIGAPFFIYLITRKNGFV